MTPSVATIRYTPRASTPVRSPAVGIQSLPAQYVHPGQVVVSNGPGVLTTILGSCVAVCLQDPSIALGGLNHYLLPNHGATGEQLGRYGPSAIEQLVQAMLGRGASRERLVAHVIGGARVLAAFAEGQHLGLRNAAVAREALAAYRIPIVSADVGGTRGRKLQFSPRDGQIAVHIIGA